jgi:hypothetical protein
MAKKKQTKKTNTDGKIEFYTEELKKSKNINEDTVKIITFAVVLLIVIALLVGLFYFNGKYVTKDKYQDPTTTTTNEAVYDNTLTTVKTMFDIKDSTYYVLAYDESDIDGKYIYNNALSFSNEKINLYKLDLTNAMNKQFYNKDKDTVVKSANNTNFKSTTLVVFKKGKVSEVLTDKEKIVELLNKEDK